MVSYLVFIVYVHIPIFFPHPHLLDVQWIRQPPPPVHLVVAGGQVEDLGGVAGKLRLHLVGGVAAVVEADLEIFKMPLILS